MGTVLAACSAGTPIPGTDGLCPSTSDFVLLALLVAASFLGCILYMIGTVVKDWWTKRHK